MRTTVGVERERFIVDIRTGKIVPAIGSLLPKVWALAEKRGLSQKLFGHELFAGQIEDRSPPCSSFSILSAALIVNDAIINEAALGLGLIIDSSEFVEAERINGLKVNPFDERHKKIWDSISPERRLAASQVAAVHIHLSATTKQALAILNACNNGAVSRLIELGDHSQGKRLAAYRFMAQTEGFPPRFFRFDELMDYIRSHGSERNVWDLVRYKPSTKTVEFRMFGATNNISEVVGYARACLQIFRSLF